MSVLNLIKVAATSFVVGAAIGGGYAAYKAHTSKRGAAKPAMDKAEQAIRDIAEKCNATIVELEIVSK